MQPGSLKDWESCETWDVARVKVFRKDWEKGLGPPQPSKQGLPWMLPGCSGGSRHSGPPVTPDAHHYRSLPESHAKPGNARHRKTPIGE